MGRPQISFLVQDGASPVLGPVMVLARHLEPDFTVEIVVPDIGHGICPIYRDAYPFKIVACPRLYRLPDYLWESRTLERAVTGDLIVAVKAFASSLPVALAAKRRRRAKVVAYFDEWDGALYARLSRRQKVEQWLRHFHHPLDDLYCPWVERLARRCDGVLCTTTALQRRFGGEVLPLGVDLDAFAPRPAEESRSLRRELGLETRKLIVFGGVVRPHKGIELILDALVAIGNPQNALVIVGPVNEHVGALQANPAYAPFLRLLGIRPREEMPRYLGLADLVVLPLANDLLAQTQMPCKVFEAMAMAKPIIASAVADLPEVLAGCGWTVPPGRVDTLARQIQWVLAHPAEAYAQGDAARQRCARLFSRDVVSQRLKTILHGILSSP